MLKVDGSTPLRSRERVLLSRLTRECTQDVARRIIVPLITKSSPVSLRVLDWTVVNWSKKHNVVCTSSVTGEVVNIHRAYLNTLSFWKRKLFDPFRRRSRIALAFDGREYETTLGQVNFAVFLHVTGIYAYVLRNVEDIEEDMNRASMQHKCERRAATLSGGKPKRHGLTREPRSKGVVYRAPCNVRTG